MRPPKRLGILFGALAIATAVASAALALAQDQQPTGTRAAASRQDGTLFTSTQIIGLRRTTSPGGLTMVAAMSPTPSGVSATTRSGNTLTIGPAAFAPAPVTNTAVDYWLVY